MDLKLKAKKDVSREHLQIRRDPASGHFFIKDLSTLGTTVNGKRVPAQHPTGQWRRSGQQCRSGTSGQGSDRPGRASWTIDFKAVKQR